MPVFFFLEIFQAAKIFADQLARLKNFTLLFSLECFQLYLPDDMLFSESDQATEVYFLSRGNVSIVLNGEVIGRKIDGETVGELAIVCPQIDRLATAMCDTCCYVYELSLDRFLEIASQFKKDFQEILKYAHYRLNDEQHFYTQLETSDHPMSNSVEGRTSRYNVHRQLHPKKKPVRSSKVGPGLN